MKVSITVNQYQVGPYCKPEEVVRAQIYARGRPQREHRKGAS
jgi:hypothetical protein